MPRYVDKDVESYRILLEFELGRRI